MFKTLYLKNREGKLEFAKSGSRKSEWSNTHIHRLVLRVPENRHINQGEFEVSYTNLVDLQKERDRKHNSISLCG